MIRTRTALAVAAAAVVLSACSSGDVPEEGAAAPTAGAPAAPSTPASPAGPFGPACATLPPQGEGSIAGMADDPVVRAAGTTPLLTTLASAIGTANLVDAFNTAPDVTVLAPANTAFEAVPADVLNPLLGDTPRLTALLTHHVIPGRLAPGELGGTHTTLSGDQLTVEGAGESFTVSADQTLAGATPATVVCGNLPTANATVYVIDQVLTPPAA
ncbi:fasciclin domain-containing protein [Geodermatophilus sp. CPCC 206100]|uniref:fasciclin domain-containing protein n=1 Tax=Geodermatophilus sp. CPCC 206100 TaxID=3020054 RepID=UPI003B002D96